MTFLGSVYGRFTLERDPLPFICIFCPETEHSNQSVSFHPAPLAKTLSFLLFRYEFLLTSLCQHFKLSSFVFKPPQKVIFLHPADISF